MAQSFSYQFLQPLCSGVTDFGVTDFGSIPGVKRKIMNVTVFYHEVNMVL